jgi:hypothetical protein
MNRDLNAILTVLAQGYDVTIEINGIDTGIRGGKSESLKLFGMQSPMVPFLPGDMKNQICLQDGKNTLTAHCKRVTENAAPELVIELKAREQFVNGGNLISLKEKIDPGKDKRFSDTFTL